MEAQHQNDESNFQGQEEPQDHHRSASSDSQRPASQRSADSSGSESSNSQKISDSSEDGDNEGEMARLRAENKLLHD